MRPARWAGGHDEEARAYLQVRLTLFTKLMFTAIVTLMAFLFVMYAAYPIAPRHNDLIFGGASVELAVMAFLWRGLLVRRTLSVQALYRIDLVYAVFIGHLLIHNVIDNDHWRHLFLIYGMLWGAIAAEKIAARASRRPMVMPSARTFTRYGPVLLPRAGR